MLSPERLAEQARVIADAQEWVSGGIVGATPLLAVVSKAAASLESDNRELNQAVRGGLPTSPAAEWLLDNYYLIEEQVILVREDLPRHYASELPRIRTGAHANEPRIFDALLDLLAHTDSRLDEENLVRFIEGYQQISPLTIGEVWAVPIMLRVGVLENLRRLSRETLESLEQERAADGWAERLVMAAQDEPERLRDLLAKLDRAAREFGEPFYVRLSQRLLNLESDTESISTWLASRLKREKISLDDASYRQQQLQAANQISIANSITSIRFLDAFEWREFFESVSVVEAALREDPGQTYGAMDFKSRDRYRHTLEELARRSPLSEREVAEQVLRLASGAIGEDPTDYVRGHVGWWLIRGGRPELERAVGYKLSGREVLYRGPLRNRYLFYGGSLAVVTAALLGLLAWYALRVGCSPAGVAWLLLLALVPVSEIALTLVNRLSAKVFPPRVLPKLDHEKPVSEGNRTLVVVPALLTSVSSTRRVIENLEVAYLANRDLHIGFALLGDLKTSDEQTHPGDPDIVEAAVRGVSELNERYEIEHGMRPFHLLIRERRFNESEGQWMGWERKRGALVELVRELHAEHDTSFVTKLGDIEFRRGVTFVLTLDADTVLPRDGARKLISTIAHPLNRAVLRPGDERVRRGYGLIQPRVGMSLPGATRTRFSRMYSGTTGVDPYATATSDTYQDVFGEGSFTGKGIFEVDVFNAVLEGRFPENTLLSHDLIEGSFLRTALASDVEVLDDYPANYLAAASRLHRWVRGDWQTLPYLGGKIESSDSTMVRNPLSLLHKWKILDNLRRSLVAPGTMLLFLAGWMVMPYPAPEWPLVLLVLVFFPGYFSLAESLLFRPRSVSFRSTAPAILRDFKVDSERALLSLAVLPHQAWINVDAAVRAVWRRFVSGRRLLEWETAADAEKRAGMTKLAFWRSLSTSAILGAAALLGLAALNGDRIVPALVVAAIWLLGPLAAWWVSQPVPAPEPESLTDADRVRLRVTARKTWRFYETFVVPDGHYLAPDNFQEDPGRVVAWRTSPTNIGLQLLSYVGAYDLGYVDIESLTSRTSETLATMAGLERFRGHFYNWYDILTLDPLRPAYVSTVDSGNLAGHLLVLRVGLLEASESPLLGPQLIEGMRDSVSLALEDLAGCSAYKSAAETLRGIRDELESLNRLLSLAEEPTDIAEWEALLRRASSLCDDALALAAVLPDADEEANVVRVSGDPTILGGDLVDLPMNAARCLTASVRSVASAVQSAASVIDRYAPWATLIAETPQSLRTSEELAPLLDHVPSLVGLAEGLDRALSKLDDVALAEGEEARWARAVADGIRAVRPAAIGLLAQLRLNADITREMWEHTDFRMLYDPHRRLFSIGFNLAEGKLDSSYYDLLASECRLASFLAVAKGDVSQEHWFRLGRSLAKTREGRALVSWSASMFEYLMPSLVMRHWPNTLLAETYATVVKRQIAYGRERSVPWGVSESAFNAKDAQLTYQYQAFGVPGLGLKRGLSDEIVVAPYACMLALTFVPAQVLPNLRALAEQDCLGRYGFYEAIDYTPGRVPAGASRAVVKSYFAHHQGMSFVAMANALDGSRMTQRFHSDPMVASAELLLQERVPRNVQVVAPNVQEVSEVRSVRELPPPVTRSYPTPHTPVPATHFLSNGRYSVMVTNGGGGYSRWEGLAVTRYREDVTRDCWGTFFYVRDVDTGRIFSAPYNPRPSEPDDYHVTFAPEKAEFRRRDGSIDTLVEVTVSPEDDVEIRRLQITNRSLQPRDLEVTSYFEIALSPPGTDQAHKSFSNLFVETEPLEETRAVLFTRRPRSSEEERVWGFHLVACEEEKCDWSFETDRAAFLGRLHDADDPGAVLRGGPLAGAHGAVLDPCCAMRRSVHIGPGQTVRLSFVTGVSADRDAAVRLTEKYSDVRSSQRAIDLSWSAAQLELRDLGISPSEAVVFERLASRLLLTDPMSSLKVQTPVENGLQMSGLWSLGISGDLPILLVRVDELEHAPLVRQALLAHQYWRHKGLVSDLVILNTKPSGYSDQLDDRLRLLVRTGHALQMLDKPGGVFLRRIDQMHPDVLNLLLSVARATLEGNAGTIELQLNRRSKRLGLPPALRPAAEPRQYPAPAFERPVLSYDNGYGGFDPGTGDYVVVLENGECTPAPWINVMASPDFGCMVSESGIGCTWALNSHENRITTWNNDPVVDGTGESIYVRDEETGEFWSPTVLPVRTPGPYTVHHEGGVSRFEHHAHGIGHWLDWFIAADKPVRICRLRLTNDSGRDRTLSVTQLVEWSLGSSRSASQQLVVTWFDAEQDLLTAHNHHNMDFPGRSAFLATDKPIHSWTASRTEFLGRNGILEDPAAMHRKNLGGASGRNHDNCGAVMVRVHLDPGETREVSFLLGQTDNLEQARKVVGELRQPGAIDAALDQAVATWDELLDTVKVSTPDPKLDLLLNRHLLYQAVSCRLWGRTAMYQSSGAFGYRDQLQDVGSLLTARPDLVRAQIVEASRHQFPEGDVQHWWQPFSARGVRTRITDDRHWLPLLVTDYLESTGDDTVLDERTAFLEGPPVPEGREDLYLQPAVSEDAATVYEHCVRALESARAVGVHGLPLMGGGDWNDGMNRVGAEGKGESVWLGWFLGYVLLRFAPICESRGETERAEDYRAWSASLVKAIEDTAWDGAWYRRAYFDDGTPLGSVTSEECKIDAIAQAWATISGLADPERARSALESVEEKLVRREDRLIRLLAPPFDHMAHDPGYIKGYVPGVRENGGQYTHAALWTILAHLIRGDGDEAADLLDMISPITHSSDRAGADCYKVEPYVVAADVYAVKPHTGRGGWTWYTGSASWFYRVAVENLLGFRTVYRDGSRCLLIDPCIPKHWQGFELDYRSGATSYHIRVDNPRGVNRGVDRISIDGQQIDTPHVAIADDGARHEVVVTMLGG
jgi:cyclic beta-1,2-glucan synthetase